MTPQPTSSASGAHHFLQGLADLGIEHVFSNLGTDHVSLIEELARWDAQGRAHPQFILCPHENVAVHMAAGYAALTGRGQAVMVHVDAGTANAVMGMHNMLRARLPVMLLALSNASTVVAVEPLSAETTRLPVAVTVPSTVKSAAVAPEVAMVADAPVAFSGPE